MAGGWTTEATKATKALLGIWGNSPAQNLKRLQNEFHLNIITIMMLSYHEHSFSATPASLLSKKKTRKTAELEGRPISSHVHLLIGHEQDS